MKTIALTSALALFATLAFTSIGFSDEHPEKNNRNRGTILDRKNVPLAIDNTEGLRTYPAGKSTAHLIGYVGKKDRKEPIIITGKAGLEKSADAQLFKKEDITLTIDSKLQKHCYDLLAAQEHPGAIVVQDPTSGEILALVSYPSFDPNLFIPWITNENYQALVDDKKNPLFNRSTTGIFPPAGTAKPLIALAGEYAGLGNPEIYCEYKFKRGNLSSENLRITSALETSSNTYFYQYGIRAGEQSLRDVGKLLHLDEPALTSLHSSQPYWMKFPQDHEVTPSDMAHISIGQGFTLLSPLHVSTITSAIATGTWHHPHLILGKAKTKASSPLIGQGKITADSLKVIREGMHLAIHGKRGIGKRAAVPGIELAGTTATALWKPAVKENCVWFSGYGPYQDPKYSVTVLLTGAKSGGGFAAPIAAKIFETLLK